MNREDISITIQRKLYAESMGRCMNPACKKDLFIGETDIAEKAHIDSYSETGDNSFENLVILCPNCHTSYDKAHVFSRDDLKKWKEEREEMYQSIFKTKYNTFDELKAIVVPLLNENRILFTKYFVGENRALWNKFQEVIISNNRRLKEIIMANQHLFQRHSNNAFSNLNVIQTFVAHIDEFEVTRKESEKIRSILFPEEIESMFGIKPMREHIFTSLETIECLISALKEKELYAGIHLELEEPYIELTDRSKLFLEDSPRLRQVLFDNHIMLKKGVRLRSLNFILKCLTDRNISYSFASGSLHSIIIQNEIITFSYEYCLSEEYLKRISPKPYTTVVNLYSWNGELSISEQAYKLAETLDVKLFTQEEFLKYVKKYTHHKHD